MEITSRPLVKRNQADTLALSTISESQSETAEPPAMPPMTLLGSADAKNKFEDLSGVDISAYANPYDALIEACGNDPVLAPFSVLQLSVTGA